MKKRRRVILLAALALSLAACGNGAETETTQAAAETETTQGRLLRRFRKLRRKKLPRSPHRRRAQTGMEKAERKAAS